MKEPAYSRLDVKIRRKQILDAALQVAQRIGWQQMTRRDVAIAAKCSGPLIAAHFGGMTAFRATVMHEAVTRKVLPVIAQGVMARHPRVTRISKELRAQALNSIGG